MGLHPKFLASSEFCGPWLKLIKESDVPIIWVNAQATVHQYMEASDIVVACYSTGLVEAALLGKTTVSWVSEIGRQKMAEALGGLTTFPTVTVGVTAEVSSPEGFSSVVLNRGRMGTADSAVQVDRLKKNLHVDGHAAERVAEAIQELIQ